MQVKSVIKIVILSFVTIVIVIYGIVFYQRLNQDRQIFDINIQNYISGDISQVLQVNKTRELNKLTPFLSGFEKLLPSIETSFTFPYYIINSENNEAVVITKLNSSQQIALREKIEENVFPAFPPQKKMYKNAELLFYTTAKQNEFFVCTFYEGIFIGGYGYKLIEKAIDAQDNKDHFFTNTFFARVIPLMQGSFPAVLYAQSDSMRSAYNISFDKSVKLSGYRSDSGPIDDDVDSLEIDFHVFPNSLHAFGAERSLEQFNDSLRYLFHAPYYQFYTEGSDVIYAMAFDVDRYKLYDVLNVVERKAIGRDLVRHGYTIGKKYSIYSGSTKFNKEVFKSDETFYFVFKDNCMAYSKDKSSLTRYVLNSGNFKGTTDDEINPRFETYFFSDNLRKLSHPYYPKEIQNRLKTDTIGEVLVYQDKSLFKIELTLNNSVDNLFNKKE